MKGLKWNVLMKDLKHVLKEEVRYALKKMKAGKATGPDELFMELTKVLEEVGVARCRRKERERQNFFTTTYDPTSHRVGSRRIGAALASLVIQAMQQAGNQSIQSFAHLP